MCVCVCVCVCVSAPRLVITSSMNNMMWRDMDTVWLVIHKVYSFCMAAIVGVVTKTKTKLKIKTKTKSSNVLAYYILN